MTNYTYESHMNDNGTKTITITYDPTKVGKGNAFITRSTMAGYYAEYEYYLVDVSSGTPVMVTRTGKQLVSSGNALDAAIELQKMLNAPVVVKNIENVDSKVRGIPRELFDELAIDVERPKSQRKDG